MGEIKREWENVPVEKAKEMYGKGMTKSEIARQLGFSEHSIRYSFIKNGIETKRRNNVFTDNEVVELYEQGNSMEKIADIFNVSRTKIRTALLKSNANIRQREPYSFVNCDKLINYEPYKCKKRETNFTKSNLKYATNSKIFTDENFFNEWSHELAYFLGWMVSDGNIVESKNTFRITSTDIEHLESLFSMFSYGWTMSIRKWNKATEESYSPAGTISIARKEIVEKMINFGITPNKSLTIEMPSLPSQYLRDFVRGVFEGDGCITYKSNLSPKIVFATGSKGFAYGLGEAIEKQTGLKKHVYVDSKNTWTLNYDSIASVKILFEYMYKGVPSNLILKRKYDVFIELFALRKEVGID